MIINTPLVLFIYNRPKNTLKIVELLKEFKTNCIYIFADGPKNEIDAIQCNFARQIIKSQTWNSRIEFHFHEKNIGINKNIISGLNYVFSKEIKAIILEDDCIPTLSFFNFCDVLLDKHINENRIMHINGTNVMANSKEMKNYEYDYFFSKYSLPSWGWATWRRAWEKFNHDFNTWEIRKKMIFINFQQKNFKAFSNLISYKYDDTILWDVQWFLDILNNKGMVIIPKLNLVENIGFETNATNTKKDPGISFKTNEICPPFIEPKEHYFYEHDKKYEDYLCSLITKIS